MNIFSLFSAKTAIMALRKNLSSQFKKEIENFDLVYTENTGTVEFIIEGKRYPFDDKMIKKLVHEKAGSYLKKNQTMDFVVLSVKGKEAEIKLYYNETIKVNNQQTVDKKFITYKI